MDSLEMFNRRFPLALGLALVLVLVPAPAASQSATPAPLEQERAKLISKVKEINRWGPDAPIVTDVNKVMDYVIANDKDAELLFGWGLTRDRQAYRFKWFDHAFSFEALSIEAAQRFGLQEMQLLPYVTDRLPASRAASEVPAEPPAPPAPPAEPAPAPVEEKATTPAPPPAAPKSLTPEAVFSRGLAYFIADAALGEPPGTAKAGRPLRGHLRLTPGPKPPAGRLFLALKLAAVTLFTSPAATKGAAPGEISFEFPAGAVLREPGEIQAVLLVVTPPKAGPGGQPLFEALSNELTVSVKVIP